MDGSLTIIDGEPGNGKTLQTVRLMLDSARRHRHITTNVALKAGFIRTAKKIFPEIKIIKPTATEAKMFWQYIPPGTDIYIDEAHLLWNSSFWKENRKQDFMEYISQFRKEGDTIYLLAQHYENLDVFIRQRASTLWTCRVLRWPKWIPIKALKTDTGGKPIIFAVNAWSTRDGERDTRKFFLPRIYTPGMCQGLYQMYDTRGTVETSATGYRHTRPTWNQFLEQQKPTESTTMATILTEENPTGETPGQQQTTAATPTVVINNQQPTPEKKTSRIKKYVLITAAIFAGVYVIGKYQQNHKPTKTTKKITRTAKTPTPPHNDKITWYGTINNSVLVAQHGLYGLWKIGVPANGYKILSASSNGVILRDPTGRMHQRKWWIPPTPHHQHAATAPTQKGKLAKL